MYQFIVPELQLRALRSWDTTMTHLVIGVVAVIALRSWRARTLHTRTPTFDVISSETISLDLSEAVS
jgi:hypothetical protein